MLTSHLIKNDVSDIAFWCAMLLIAASQLLGAWLVFNLKSKHGVVYEKLGKPPFIGRMGFFVYRLSWLDEYKYLSVAEKMVARLLQAFGVFLYVLFIIFFISVFMDFHADQR